MNYGMDGDTPLLEFIRNWAYYVKQPEVKRATYDRLLISINTLDGSDICGIPIREVTIADVRDYVSGLIDYGYSYSTVKKQFLIVSAPMKYAYENRIIGFNPCMAVHIPSEDKMQKETKQIEAYTPDEQDRIRMIFMRDRNRYWLVPDFIMETGMRIGEVMALRWCDVDIYKRRVRIHSTMLGLRNGCESFLQESAKSKSSNRVIPLSHHACDILQSLHPGSPGEFIFTNEHGSPIEYKPLRRAVKDLCDLADVPYYGLHVWRHTFATNQYYKGTDVKILSKLLGHATPTITYNTYIHLYGDGFEDMLKAID